MLIQRSVILHQPREESGPMGSLYVFLCVDDAIDTVITTESIQ